MWENILSEVAIAFFLVKTNDKIIQLEIEIENSVHGDLI